MSVDTFFLNRCPACRNVARVRIQLLGQSVNCVSCGARFAALETEGSAGLDSAKEGHSLDISILVIGDHESDLDVLCVRMSRLGHSVVAVHHPRRALAAITNRRFELVLLYSVPMGYDSFVLLHKLKRMADLEVIVFNSQTDATSRRKALQAGAFAVVSKPFDFQQVRDMVENAIYRLSVDRIERQAETQESNEDATSNAANQDELASIRSLKAR